MRAQKLLACYVNKLLKHKAWWRHHLHGYISWVERAWSSRFGYVTVTSICHIPYPKLESKRSDCHPHPSPWSLFPHCDSRDLTSPHPSQQPSSIPLQQSCVSSLTTCCSATSRTATLTTSPCASKTPSSSKLRPSTVPISYGTSWARFNGAHWWKLQRR